MKKRFLYGLVLAGLGLNLLVGSHIYFSNAVAAEKDDPYPMIKLFTYVLEKVRAEYVDGDKVSYQDLVNGALKGMISTLDPHSEFMDSRKYKNLKDDTEGTFGGIGVVVAIKEGYVTVSSPMDDSPGFKAGIQRDDRILKINGRSTEKFTLTDTVKLLRGEPGTKVAITVLRPATNQTIDYELTRAIIKLDTVSDINGRREFPLLENGVGYLRLSQFGEHTSAELEEALKKLEGAGMTSLVMDLRDNPGGLLDQAVKVCEKFLPRGQLVVSTEGRDEKDKSRYVATGRTPHPPMPKVILVNGGSASAAEIVAGCMQDLQDKTKVIVVGEQTFGKGSVQSILPLQDGAALRLTTAKYYTPSHKVIHEKGITPDIIVPMSPEEERDIAIKRSPGGIDSLEEKDRQRVKNARDLQLERAVDLLKGISLYSAQNKVEDKLGPAK